MKQVFNKIDYRSLLSRIESQRFFVGTNLCEECEVSEITLVGGAQSRQHHRRYGTYHQLRILCQYLDDILRETYKYYIFTICYFILDTDIFDQDLYKSWKEVKLYTNSHSIQSKCMPEESIQDIQWVLLQTHCLYNDFMTVTICGTVNVP